MGGALVAEFVQPIFIGLFAVFGAVGGAVDIDVDDLVILNEGTEDLTEVTVSILYGATGEALDEVFNQVEAFIKPVIAVVNGFCLGGGCELAMACHMRIAEEHARFGQPEVNLGLLPGYGATQRMTKLIGKARSIEYHVTADMIDADTAVQIGLVNHKTPLGEGVAKAEEILKKVATKGPLAVSACINVINKYDDHEVDAFDLESKLFAKVMLTEDAKEGTQAFMEKRKANFKGQ